MLVGILEGWFRFTLFLWEWLAEWLPVLLSLQNFSIFNQPWKSKSTKRIADRESDLCIDHPVFLGHGSMLDFQGFLGTAQINKSWVVVSNIFLFLNSSHLKIGLPQKKTIVFQTSMNSGAISVCFRAGYILPRFLNPFIFTDSLHLDPPDQKNPRTSPSERSFHMFVVLRWHRKWAQGCPNSTTRVAPPL